MRIYILIIIVLIITLALLFKKEDKKIDLVEKKIVKIVEVSNLYKKELNNLFLIKY